MFDRLGELESKAGADEGAASPRVAKPEQDKPDAEGDPDAEPGEELDSDEDQELQDDYQTVRPGDGRAQVLAASS